LLVFILDALYISYLFTALLLSAGQTSYNKSQFICINVPFQLLA